MNISQWQLLGRLFKKGYISETHLLSVTEKEKRHPDWWDYACHCYGCRRLGL